MLTCERISARLLRLGSGGFLVRLGLETQKARQAVGLAGVRLVLVWLQEVAIISNCEAQAGYPAQLRNLPQQPGTNCSVRQHNATYINVASVCKTALHSALASRLRLSELPWRPQADYPCRHPGRRHVLSRLAAQPWYARRSFSGCPPKPEDQKRDGSEPVENHRPRPLDRRHALPSPTMEQPELAERDAKSLATAGRATSGASSAMKRPWTCVARARRAFSKCSGVSTPSTTTCLTCARA